MIALDTNLLVYAHREDAPWHDAAFARIRELAESRAPWAIPWPCLHEFLAIATHPRIYAPPTPLAHALDQIAAWMEAPSLVLLSEGRDTGRYFVKPFLRRGPQEPRCTMPGSRRSVDFMASRSSGPPTEISAGFPN